MPYVTWRQARLTRELIAVARDEFISSHPPEIIVRRVSLDQGTLFAVAPITRPWKIQYILANTGRSSATIFEGNATVKQFTGSLPAIPPFEDTFNLVLEVTLGAGESVPLTSELDPQDPIVARVRLGQTTDLTHGDGAEEIYFFGYMLYRDNIGVVRRTAFCRRLDIQTQRFIVVSDPDYEYRD